MDITKNEVEELLGHQITDEQFREALVYAKRKQAYIYEQEQREVVLQRWYLVQLTKEYVINLAFSRLTTGLCRTLRDMEKECSVEDQNTLTHTHIVAQPTA